MSSERIERLIGVHYKRLIKYVEKFSGLNRLDAASVVNDALFEVHRRIASIKPGAEAAYAYDTARDRARNFIRDRKAAVRDWRVEREVTAAANIRDDGAAPDELLIQRERQQRMKEVLAQLPELTRLCLLGDVNGESSEEIGRKLGMNSATVRSRIARARQQLKKQFGEDAHDLRK